MSRRAVAISGSLVVALASLAFAGTGTTLGLIRQELERLGLTSNGVMVSTAFTGGSVANQITGGGLTYLEFPAALGIAPVSSNGACGFTYRNNHSLITCDNTTIQGGSTKARAEEWEGHMPLTYSGGNLTVQVPVGSSATTGNVVVAVAFERCDVGTLDYDTDSFSAERLVTVSLSGTSGVMTMGTLTFTQSQADGIVAGDAFRVRVEFRHDDLAYTSTGTDEVPWLVVHE